MFPHAWVWQQNHSQIIPVLMCLWLNLNSEQEIILVERIKHANNQYSHYSCSPRFMVKYTDTLLSQSKVSVIIKALRTL